MPDASRNASESSPSAQERVSTPDSTPIEERFELRGRKPKHPPRPCLCGRKIAWLWSVCRACGRLDPAWRILNDPRIDRTDDCWLWLGARDDHGYGRFNKRRVHRIAWEETTGESAEGFEVMHTCDNPPCLNPAHLQKATHAENMQDAWAKGILPDNLWKRSEWTVCQRGLHPLSGDNLYVYPSGVRECRTCKRERRRVWEANRRAA